MSPLTTPNPYTIYVFQSESGQYRVWPPVLVVPAGAQAWVCNFTPEPLSLSSSRWPGIKLGPVAPDDKAPLPTDLRRGGYPYEIIVNGKYRAVAHSDPSIIVD